MNKQLIAGLSVLALFAVMDVAAAQKSGGAPGAATGASPGKEGGANMGAGDESPGASERGSSPGSPSERGTSSEKGAASEQRSDKGTDKGSSKDKSSDRTQSSDKDKSTRAAKESDTSKSDHAAKESKGDTSSGAASGESGRPGPSTAEGRGETSGKSHVSLSSDQRTRVQSAFKSHLGSAGCLSVNASSVLCVSFTRETLTPAPASVDLGDRIQRQFFETLGITRGPDPGIACRMCSTPDERKATNRIDALPHRFRAFRRVTGAWKRHGCDATATGGNET